MNIKVKFTILSLVFVLSTVFFWLAINEYLLQSKAQQASDLQIVPHAQEIECNPKGECYVHILGSTATDNAVAGVTGHINYSEMLTPVRVDQLGLCKDSSYGTDTALQFKDDEENRVVTFSVGSLRADDELKGGNGCITTVVFKPTGITEDPTTTWLRLYEFTTHPWKAGGLIAGAKGTFKAQIDSTDVTVKIDSSVVWPPKGEPTPTGTQNPGSCRMFAKGDCDCNATVDLVDWEELRSAYLKEGGSCDFNEDGNTNAIDASIWIRNNDLIGAITTQ